MARTFEYIDLFFSIGGDICIENGDVKDTSGAEILRSDKQELREIIRSTQGDWSLDVELGANTDNYLGQLNTLQTGENMKKSIINAIARDKTFDLEDIIVTVVPVSYTSILARIDMFIGDEFKTNLDEVTISSTFLYDTSTKGITFVG